MWIPQNAAEIEEAARRGDLEETASFDAKAELPVPKKNASLAVDVAAMSTDGGALLYGIAEDEHKQPTCPQPISLVGAADRVAQIVQTSIAEVPYFEPREYQCDDPSKGYLLLIVPPSPRAPHQVIVGGDLRFYGRGAKGNRILTEGEVARLYQRRHEWEQDRDALLAEAVAQAPVSQPQDLAFLHGFARPVAPDRAIWDRAIASTGGRDVLQAGLAESTVQHGNPSRYAPNLINAHWTQQGADEWRLSSRLDSDYSNPLIASSLVNVRLNIDGRGHLFCGRAADTRQPDDRRFIFESIIAGNFVAFLAMLATLYRMGGYYGHVDVGLAVTGLRGGHSATLLDRMVVLYDELPTYNADSYPRHERVAAAELDDPETVARRLLRHLFEATTGHDDFDPFD